MTSNQDLAIVVNTNSNYKDIWPMFFGELRKYSPSINSYTFVNSGVYEYSPGFQLCDYTGVYRSIIYYDNSTCFRDQYLSCIKQVPEKYCLTMNDDYVLYNSIDFDKIKEYINILEKTDYSFVRFTSTDENHQDMYTSGLYKIPFYSSNLYSQTASIWKTRILEKIHEKGPQLHIGTRGDKDGHFEDSVNNICMSLGIQGLVCWNREKKRGIAHYDSNIFPYIASALVRGKWNIKEYSEELMPLIKKYNIDISKRGIYNG
jgi:hypothetical protein